MGAPRHTVLMCDDSDADRQLTTIAWEEAGIEHDLEAVASGDELLTYVRNGKPVHLILLDMNMPRMSGMDILAALKGDEATAHIPVLLFTSSTWDKEVRAGYGAGASGFLTKPFELDDLIATLKAIDTFWLSIALLPG